MDSSGSRSRGPSVLTSPRGGQNNAVDRPIRTIDDHVLLPQRGPDVDPNLQWSKYNTADATGEPAPIPITNHSIPKAPPTSKAVLITVSILTTRTRTHGSRFTINLSPASHGSRGPMMASQGILAGNKMGSNTGVSNTLHSASPRHTGTLTTTFKQASYARAGL